MTDIRDTENLDRCIALAGMFQAARLVQQTSRAEKRDEIATAASINSLFVTDPDTVADVYGEPATLHVGLLILQSQLGSSAQNRDMEMTAYVITLMRLERKLARQPDLMGKISAGLLELKEKTGYNGQQDATLITGLADIYKDTVSTLTPRIMVKGDENVLGNSSSQNMIRALLLAGIRATVLWSQCGGSRLKLILQRKAMKDSCSRMLKEINQAS